METDSQKSKVFGKSISQFQTKVATFLSNPGVFVCQHDFCPDLNTNVFLFTVKSETRFQNVNTNQTLSSSPRVCGGRRMVGH